MNIAAWLDRHARTFPDRPGIARGTGVHATFREWARRVRRVAAALRGPLGCAAGDRVALCMTNSPEYLEAKWAIWHAGLCAVPVNARLHRNEFEYILGHSEAKLAFVSPDLAETVAGLAPRIVVCPGDEWRKLAGAEDELGLVGRAPTDPAWLFYTSGTTGRPKGATLTHRTLLVASLSYFADIDFLTPEDAVLHAAPLSHGSGLYGIPHVARAAASVIPESGHFDAAEIAELLQSWPGMSFFAAPTMVTRLIAHPVFATADHANLKTIVYGGAPMYVEDLKRALDLLGPKLQQIYGQGEAPMTITGLSKAMHADRAHPRWEARLGSAGIARTDVEVRVVDDEDRDLPVGETGEIICRGDVVMSGYWRNPEATAATLRGGWLHTGDVGAFDGDGFLTLKDRSKDVIISGGTNIYPREIEEVLLKHPCVVEVSVVGKPDRDWGESVVAFVVRRKDVFATEDDLDRLCLESIARFKRPKEYVFVDALPKNNYGKVLKTELRKQLA
jgi:long-chain acyl-CoA synthetase